MANNKYKGSLELNWINKDKSLLYEIDEEESVGIKPVWVEKDDIQVSEPRILKLKEEYGDPDNENMLIKGDNLLALRTLAEEFKNREEKDKIKCIYIDPPFNTGSAFEHYDDNLEHSQWLTMMRDRLVLLRQLLREDGTIFIHMDEMELFYLKILLDEIFGRNNFLSLVTIKSKASAGVGQESYLFNICEYELIYGKNQSSAQNRVKLITEPLGENITKVYNKILITMGDDLKIKTISGGNVGDIDVYVHDNYTITTLSTKERTDENYFKWYEKIFRTTNPQGGLMKRVMPQIPSKGLVSIEYVPTKGRSAGEIYRYYFIDGSLIVWLKDTATKVEDEKTVLKQIKNNNLWEENLYQGIAKEGNVEFKQSKKPEKLIKRILEMSSELGDIILDSFLGSGTTAAVAHKMGRRWIGIEIGKHADTHCNPRLVGVINGEDSTGISKDDNVNWQGGGGFRYYEVGESIIKDLDMNWDMTLEEMSRAVFMNFDYSFMKGETYKLQGCDDDFYIGKQKGGIAICLVTKGTKIIKRQELNKLIKDLRKKHGDKKITIFTNMGVAVKPEEIGEQLDVRKIPESILKKYRMV